MKFEWSVIETLISDNGSKDTSFLGVPYNTGTKSSDIFSISTDKPVQRWVQGINNFFAQHPETSVRN